MRQSDELDRRSHVVVANGEGQYALWPAGRTPPEGWQQVAGPDDKGRCLEWVREHWTDLTPLSLRRPAG
ncbi:MAG TPA: MbtH family NRPS accessory protein [Stellaceae bacterium]|nr:MbtH family NRPS accessory protein [Stellaceae bacterium]